jgi:orotidine-5'-phosphate decarboxylase
MWMPVDEPWQYRVLDQLPPGIDLAQLDQARRMTPTERVEAMVRLVKLGEEIRRQRAGSSGDR